MTAIRYVSTDEIGDRLDLLTVGCFSLKSPQTAAKLRADLCCNAESADSYSDRQTVAHRKLGGWMNLLGLLRTGAWQGDDVIAIFSQQWLTREGKRSTSQSHSSTANS